MAAVGSQKTKQKTNKKQIRKTRKRIVGKIFLEINKVGEKRTVNIKRKTIF